MHRLGKTSLNKRTGDEKQTAAQARIAFMCSTLLGLTWLFALLAVGKATELFQWLFCIFNSLQGFFIFIFYTLRNTDVRREWLTCFGIKDGNESTTGSIPQQRLEMKNKKKGNYL